MVIKTDMGQDILMKQYALNLAANPPHYCLPVFNCWSFVMLVVGLGTWADCPVGP